MSLILKINFLTWNRTERSNFIKVYISYEIIAQIFVHLRESGLREKKKRKKSFEPTLSLFSEFAVCGSKKNILILLL